jgi:hypothetical protein
MTAEEFIRQDFDEQRIDRKHVQWLMVEFARLKGKEILEVAADKAEVKIFTESWGDYETSYNVDRSSILNAFDLNSIV